jgi:hypothetical protein
VNSSSLTTVFGAASIAVVILGVYFGARWRLKHEPMPVAAWALMWIGGFLAVGGLLASLLSQLPGATVGFAIGIPLALACVLGFGAWIVRWMRDRRTAGALVLDCGPNPGRITLLLSAAICLLFAVVAAASLLSLSLFAAALVMLAGIVAATTAAILAFGRWQIREHGIWHGELVPWSRLQSYRWEGADNGDLRIEVKAFEFLRSDATWMPAFHVPAVHRAAVDDELRLHCPVAEPD